MTGRDAKLRAPPRGDSRRAVALRWLGAGALALGLHAGVALLLVRETRPEPLDDGGGDAVMVELEPVEGEAAERDTARQAVPADDPTAAAAAADAQSSQSMSPATDTPPQPDPPVRPPPDPSPEPSPPVQAPPSPPEAAPPSEAPPVSPASPPPPATPPVAPFEGRPEPPVASPVRAAPASASSAASAAAAEAAPAVQRLSAARAASWRGKLVPHLNRFRRALPGGIGGTARIGFTVDAAGRVTATSVATSSGDDALDEAARELIRRASPFPAPPPGLTGAALSFVVPVHYDGARR